MARSGHTRNVVPGLGLPGNLAPVDVSTWGATLVSRVVFDAGILPDPELFFGFEDFDFFCAVREGGFSVVVDVPCARRVAHLQTLGGRDEALRQHRPVDEEEPWRAYYFARNFFALARRHGRRSWYAWHLVYSVRRLQLAKSAAERRAIVHGLWDGARGRLGVNERYIRTAGERDAPADAEDITVARSADSSPRPVPSSVPAGRERAGRVVALVLSHNAPESLRRCLTALNDQTVRPDAVIVVDNGSDPPVAAETLPDEGLPVRVVTTGANLGPAGGWARAFEEFADGHYELAWVLDDDIRPDPDCLEFLWNSAREDLGAAFCFPRAIQPDGEVGEWGSWCGFLISRGIVEQVGVPRAELFWWAEDNEYCHWRIPQAGYPRKLVDGAVVQHDAVRHGSHVPTWKYYYEARNMLYLHLHVMHRLGWYPRNVTKLVGRAVLHERGRRLKSFDAIGRGLVDGAVGRLGIRYPIAPMHEQPLRAPTGKIR